MDEYNRIFPRIIHSQFLLPQLLLSPIYVSLDAPSRYHCFPHACFTLTGLRDTDRLVRMPCLTAICFALTG